MGNRAILSTRAQQQGSEHHLGSANLSNPATGIVTKISSFCFLQFKLQI